MPDSTKHDHYTSPGESETNHGKAKTGSFCKIDNQVYTEAVYHQT